MAVGRELVMLICRSTGPHTIKVYETLKNYKNNATYTDRSKNNFYYDDQKF